MHQRIASGFLMAGAFCIGSQALALQEKGKVKKVNAVPGEYIVQLRNSDVSLSAVDRLLAQRGFEFEREIPAADGLFVAKLGEDRFLRLDRGVLGSQDVDSGRFRALVSDAMVRFAEPNYIYSVQGGPVETKVPNDPSFQKLWGMNNTGQADPKGRMGVNDADIDAVEAWSVETGSKDVVVAVVDTGIDYLHPNLKNNMWVKPKVNPEDPTVHGFNAITKIEDPMDDNSHGTHCSGTIGAEGNKGLGVAGVAWNTSLMGVKFLSGGGSGTLEGAILAIDYATNNGARVMSNSWGGGGYSQALKDAIQRAREKGILFVAAAGNDSSDNDSSPAYPASYDLDNVVSVAASTNLDTVASFSNFGKRSVHLMAPGENIYSTVPEGKYDTYSGTSMATPHVSGAAALLWSKEPQLSYLEVKDRLIRSTDKWKALSRKVASAGRLNVNNLILGIEPQAPDMIPESAWSEPVAQEASTPHPYANNTRLSWTFEHPGATFVRVRFARLQTESGYDLVTIKDGDGNVVEELSGILPAGSWSSEVKGSKVVVEFSSDDSIQGYGVDIDASGWTDFAAAQLN